MKTAQELYQFVKDNAAALKADADAGDSNAKNIITTYNMLTKFVESGALGILAAAIEDWKQGREIGEIEELLCPVCQIEIATTENNVDWRSDTTIRCCEDCYDLLGKFMRYDAQKNMPKSFHEKYKTKLDNAIEELKREYVRLYGNSKAGAK